MKKSAKILTVFLALVTIVTAFTVVSLATEGNELKPLSYKSPTWTSNDFETYEDGYAICDTPDRPGKVTIVEQDNGNKMALMEYADGTGTTVQMWDFSATYDVACSIVNYEYFAIEFDIMTLNGTYDGTSIYTQVLNSGTRLDFLTNTKFTEIGLSTTPYDWNHLTIVVKYNGDQTFTQYAYVNGELAKAYAAFDFSENSAWKALDGNYSNVRVRDFRVYPDAYSSPESQVALDNFRFTYYPNNYLGDDLDAIANCNFGEDYVFPYKYTVATLTDNESGEVTYYDDFKKAFDAANASNTLTLFEDANDTYMIDKAVNIDTAGFTFNWESRSGYSAAASENLLTFTKAADAVTVIWDPACDGECSCYFKPVGHIMSEESIYAPGITPKYYGEIPSFEITNGLEIEFLGWTYKKGGKEVQEITAVSTEQAVNGTLYLYPVYRLTQYAAEIIDSQENSRYITGEDFAAEFSTLANGSTIKLWSDLTLTQTLNFGTSSKTTTFDLNGFNVYRLGTKFTDYEAVLNEETGKYEKGDALESPANVSIGALFGVAKNYNTFILTSSRPGSEIYSAMVTANRLLLNGEVVASEVTKTTSDGIFSVSAAYTTLNILGENLTVFSNYVIYAEHGGGSKTCSYNVDGGTYVKIPTSTTGMFHVLRGGTHTVKNALLIANGSYCGRTTSYNEGTNITFENCDIINAITNCTKSTDAFTFKNCRINSSFNLGGTVTFAKGTRLSSEINGVTYEEGAELLAHSKDFTYTYATAFEIDPITLLPYASNTAERTTSFSYLVINPETDLANVTWKDFNGNVIKTEKLLKGESALPPVCTESVDGWRGALVNNWLDADGNEFNLVITDTDEQVYTAVRPTIDENTEYVPSITDARLNFSYVSQFHMYLYLPVTEGMDRPTVTGYTPNSASGTALINSKNYWVYTWWCSTATVGQDYVADVNFEIDGVSYTQSFKLSALVYAEIVLADPVSDEEAAATANMIRYVKEARKISGKTLDERFDNLIGSDDGTVEGLYTLPAYAESYPDDSLDLSAISEYIDSFAIVITGGTPAFQFNLSAKAIELGMTKSSVSIKTLSGKTLDIFDYAHNGKTYQTNNVKVYNAMETLVVKVSVPAVIDSDSGETVTPATTVSANYSIGTYIKGVEAQGQNADLIKALYAFGNAVIAYRNSVLDY